MPQQQKKGRKYGRNSNSCNAYATAGRKAKNKRIRMLKTLRNQPHNYQVFRALIVQGEKETYLEQIVAKSIDKLDAKEARRARRQA
jgi:hypothetical protein